MKTRCIVVVLDADALGVEIENIRAAAANKQYDTVLLEGAFMRCGQTFELPDMPQLFETDMVMFTGTWGDDHRQRRIRLMVNAGYYDVRSDSWFAVVVSVVPRAKVGDWTWEGVAHVIKGCRPEPTVFNLIDEATAETSIINAVIVGWEAFQSHRPPPFDVLFGRGCGDPDCEACNGEENPEG